MAKFWLGKAREFVMAKFWQGKVCYKLVTWQQEAWELVVAKLSPGDQVREADQIGRSRQAF